MTHSKLRTTIRLDALIPTPEYRDHLLVALQDVLGDCVVDEMRGQHVLEGARRVEWTRSHRVVLYISPVDPPSFDLVHLMSQVCDRAGVDSWSMTTWAPVPHLAISMQDGAVEF